MSYDIASSSEVETEKSSEVQTTAFRLSESVFFLMVTFAAVLETIPDNARTDLKNWNNFKGSQHFCFTYYYHHENGVFCQLDEYSDFPFLSDLCVCTLNLLYVVLFLSSNVIGKVYVKARKLIIFLQTSLFDFITNTEL